jgi:hypothetical protein
MSQPPGWVTVYDPHPVRRFFHRVVLYLGLVEGYPEPDDDVDLDLSEGDIVAPAARPGAAAERDEAAESPVAAEELWPDPSAFVEYGFREEPVGDVVDEAVDREWTGFPSAGHDGVTGQ